MSSEIEPVASEAPACPHCRELEQRVAELERRLAESEGGHEHQHQHERELNRPGLGPVEMRALRINVSSWGAGWGLRPSPARRFWMDQVAFSYQCLPLVMANQWGWQVLCPTDVRATWNGSADPSGVRVEVPPQYEVAIKSQFGAGIVTFSPPWLFRTPPGWDLYAKGPGNRWKTNCVPLEGVIETWWLNYTFTLNWKIVEPGTVTFARGESLGQIMPVPHNTFQDASAVEAPIMTEPKAAEELIRWRQKRRDLIGQPVTQHKLYRKAEGIDDHLVKLSVPPFVATGGIGGPPPGPMPGS
jgi:hypothetical protein